MIGDGRCDEACNTASCTFDGPDCFHGHTECYRRADAADYRGMVSYTASGLRCQRWSRQSPQCGNKLIFC